VRNEAKIFVEQQNSMTAALKGIHPVLSSNDVTASLRFYSRLGFQLAFQDDPTEPKYAVVVREGSQLHIQWADMNQWAYPVDRPAYRFCVDDVDDICAEFVASGPIVAENESCGPWRVPANTPWGTREFHLLDPGRNSLQFYCPI
jgi:predicted enzyme related to lactoylglutathione lyase